MGEIKFTVLSKLKKVYKRTLHFLGLTGTNQSLFDRIPCQHNCAGQ